MHKLTEILKNKFNNSILKEDISKDGTSITVNPVVIKDICLFLRDNLGFNFLADLTAVDYTPKNAGFCVIYHFRSFSKKEFVRIKCYVSQENPQIDSITELWAGANWLEREVYDMFGIVFNGHPDLRRILLWDTFPGYPLRKSFYYRENVEIPFDDVQKEVIRKEKESARDKT